MAEAPSSITRASLAARLRETLGEDKATELVNQVADQLGLPATDLTLTEALRVLDALASRPGLVGIVSRFAKARLHLRR
jgi:hypothetical protein